MGCTHGDSHCVDGRDEDEEHRNERDERVRNGLHGCCERMRTSSGGGEREEEELASMGRGRRRGPRALFI